LECPNCGFENPPGRRYCEECAERLTDIEAVKERERRRSQREGARYRREAEKDGLGAEEAERRRRRTRRRTSPLLGVLILVIVIVAIIVTIVLVTGSGLSAPEKSVVDFYNAIKNRDVMTYLKHIDTQMYKQAVKGDYQPDLYGVGIDYDSYRLENLKTQLEKQDADTAQVKVIAGYFEGIYDDGSSSGGVDFSQYPREITLYKEEGAWMIDNYNLVKLPYPLPEVLPDASEFPEVPSS
jgi:hypothetical protein